MSGDPLPPESVMVIDTSVVIAIGTPDNEKYRALEQYVTRNGITVRVPDYVASELGDSPDVYQYRHESLQAAQDAGWVEPISVSFDDPAVSAVIDRTRERMASLSAEDVTEDEIEKTDTVLAGVAYQLTQTEASIGVLVSDRVAERAIADVLSAEGCDVTIVKGREFLKTLTESGLN